MTKLLQIHLFDSGSDSIARQSAHSQPFVYSSRSVDWRYHGRGRLSRRLALSRPGPSFPTVRAIAAGTVFPGSMSGRWSLIVGLFVAGRVRA
jgi:hypothetical protein